MMRLRTECTPEPLPAPIQWNEPLFFAGSCFADHMFRKHTECLFDAFAHPTGIVFHPDPLLRGLADAMAANPAPEALICDQGLWHSLNHHGAFSAPTQKEAEEKILRQRQRAEDFLRQAQVLIITWGTAWGYRHASTNTIVANCHKIPQHQFSKECSTPQQLVEMYSPVLMQWLGQNPLRRVIITVSPVRYLKDGFEGNALSKATLLLAAHDLAKSLERVHYFPAYEIFNDDLRDYRFVKEDMVHPTEQAIAYIWEKWKYAALDSATQKGLEKLLPLQKRALHRPIHTEVQEDFQEQMLALRNAVCLNAYGQLPAQTTVN